MSNTALLTGYSPITPSEAARPIPVHRRLGSLIRAEFVLLLRNRMQLFTALAMPLAVPFLFLPLKEQGVLDGPAGVAATSTMMLFVLLFVVFYNLTCSYVVRREERVLQRLRAGTVSQPLVLASTAAPAVTLAIAQSVVMCVVGGLLLDLPIPVNLPLLVVAVLLATGAFVGLALITTVYTKNVEAAQLTTMPIMTVLILGAGTFLPLDVMPEFVQKLIILVPSAAVTELTGLAWNGLTAAGESVDAMGALLAAWQPALVLVLWCVLGAYVTRRSFRCWRSASRNGM